MKCVSFIKHELDKHEPTKMEQCVVQYVITLGVAECGNLHLCKCVHNPDLSWSIQVLFMLLCL